MVKARWVGNSLVVEPVTTEECMTIPPFVQESINAVGIAVANGIAYSVDEQTAREILEW